ncbi:MAG TPA: TaqI-like C-terminal specificity domain-containing protein [Candidatus Kapabacteria bacterium]|nr:TaqI-like C-terminal specificity domain-containing protein [Candidatus Kapabacteria bacterium]
MTPFEQAYTAVAELVGQFEANEAHYLSPVYQEAEVREDFINKFWEALGWDVRHISQTNPREQEVKVEKNPDSNSSGRRADYAFYLKPDFKNPSFFVEAKKPSVDLSNSESYFQIVRYGRGASTPVGVLTDFAKFHIVDCRYEPHITKSYPSAQIKVFGYKEYLDREAFGYIYWLFSREAIEAGKLKEFAKELPKQRGKGAAKLTADEARPTDEKFLDTLEDYRLRLAKAFKKSDESLTAEALTEATQKVIDRLVFIRFLEDKNIEADYIVDQIASKSPSPSGRGVRGEGRGDGKGDGGAWKSFIAWSKELDVKYNGVVFKPHEIDKPTFTAPDDKVFAEICAEISHSHSKYIFSYIPVELLGSIYERFLGKVVTATAKRADIEYKPEVRKAGGVYYTPKYIVDYIVANTVGKILFPIARQTTDAETGIISGVGRRLTPAQVSKLRFADIACGSGSFLIAVYDAILHHVELWYNSHPDEAKKAGCIEIDKNIYSLSLKQKQKILLDNIYGVDIDPQAVEVAQLSLFLKLLENESGASTGQISFEKTKILPDLSKNIVCGNSLVDYDIETLFTLTPEEELRVKPFSFETTFKDIMSKGGFDAIVGNPPYITLGGKEDTVYPRFYTSYLTNRYLSAEYKPNFFTFFYQRGYELLRTGGLVSLIVPRTFIDNYYFGRIRVFFQEKSRIIRLDKFNYEVFAEATIGGSAIAIFQKEYKPTSNTTLVEVAVHENPKELEAAQYSKVKQATIISGDNQAFSFLNEILRSLMEKIKIEGVPLEEICSVNNGVNTGNAADILLSRENKGQTYRRILEGKDVNRYGISWGGWWVNYDPELKKTLDPKNLKTRQGKVDFALRDSRIFDSPKIVIRQTSDKLIGCCDYDGYISRHSTHCILVENTSLDLKYILGLFNSRMMNFYYQSLIPETGKAFAEVKAVYVKSLPFRNLDLANPGDKHRHDEVVNLVDQILEAKKRLATARSESERTQLERKCEYLDAEIDKRVYELYGLTEEEIAVVEGRG